MTLAPNTPITQENVGLLKAGDWLLRTGNKSAWPEHRLVRFSSYDPEQGVIWERVDGVIGVGSIQAHAYIGSDLGGGWIGWSGGENPVPGMAVEYRVRSGSTWALPQVVPSEALRGWQHAGFSGDIIAFRPALSPPAEGEPSGMSDDERRRWLAGRDDWQKDQWQDHCGKAGCEECSGEIPMTRRRTPTPAPADHIGDATEKVDWNVVGPTLVERLADDLEAEIKGRYGDDILSYPGIKRKFDADMEIVTEARAALAPTQPQSNGE